MCRKIENLGVILQNLSEFGCNSWANDCGLENRTKRNRGNLYIAIALQPFPYIIKGKIILKGVERMAGDLINIYYSLTHDSEYIRWDYCSLERAHYCMHCKLRLGKYGKRRKHFKDEYGVDHTIMLQMYRCSGCKAWYIEFPDCFVRGKRYLRTVVDKVRSNEKLTGNMGPSRATISRWRREYRKISTKLL